MCCSLPSSVGKTSKIRKVDASTRAANHAVVSGSASTRGSAPSRNSATSFSLPGAAIRRTQRPTVTIAVPPFLSGGRVGGGPHRATHPLVSWTDAYLTRGELRVRQRGGEVRRRCLGGETDHRAVDVDPARSVGGGLAGRRIDAGEQVGPAGGQVADLVLVDLALVETFLPGLVRPEAELSIPH